LLAQEDSYWCQRAKVHWYRDDDHNTKFLHASATVRRKVNCITSLEDDFGNKTIDNQGMCLIAKCYFTELFQKNQSVAEPVVNVIRSSISSEDNVSFMQPFTKDEFRVAIFSMHSDKCPGPDGYSPGFYQHFWDLCSDNILTECCSWLDIGQFPATLNMTNVALIPKGNTQITMKDWRPIPLCNVLYKLISKVLANRLKRVLPHCIFDSQSTFVPD